MSRIARRATIARVVFVFCLGFNSAAASGQIVDAETISECGIVSLDFNQSPAAYSKFAFAKKHAKPPIVIASECGSKGSFIVVKTEDITKTHCTIVAYAMGSAQLTYKAQVAYIVIDQAKVRHPKAVNLLAQGSKKRSTKKPVRAAEPPAQSEDEEPTRITWQEYMRACGIKAQQANEARTVQLFAEQYQDKVVRWTGTIQGVIPALIGSGSIISIQMHPTESIQSDIILRMPRSVDVTRFNKGDTISFVGRIRRQGGTITDHEIEFIRF